MTKAVFCTAKTSSLAAQIEDRLKAAGFSNSDISVLMSDKGGKKTSPLITKQRLLREQQLGPVPALL